MLTESKSVKERLENLFRDLANNILNMGMKMAMNGIWSNLIGGLTRGFGASPMDLPLVDTSLVLAQAQVTAYLHTFLMESMW